MGTMPHTAYDLDHTNYILSFGADLLESSKPLSRYLRKWGKIRREKPNRTKIVVIHPRYSVTAAKSDEWIPINPGTEGALAMAIAHVMMSEDLFDKTFVKDWTVGFDAYKATGASSIQPEGCFKNHRDSSRNHPTHRERICPNTSRPCFERPGIDQLA